MINKNIFFKNLKNVNISIKAKLITGFTIIVIIMEIISIVTYIKIAI